MIDLPSNDTRAMNQHSEDLNPGPRLRVSALLRLLSIPERDVDVRPAPLDDISRPARSRLDAFHHRPPSTRDSETTRSSMSRAPRSSALPRALFKHLLQQACALVRKKAQRFHRLVRTPAADQRREGPNLSGRHVRIAVMCLVLHRFPHHASRGPLAASRPVTWARIREP